MLKRNGGFTLIELLIAVAVIGIVVVGFFGIGVVYHGNYWYSNDSVLQELKVDYPETTEVLKTKRNVFAKSVITVRENGVNRDFCLDTNVLQNYKFSDCSK